MAGPCEGEWGQLVPLFEDGVTPAARPFMTETIRMASTPFSIGRAGGGAMHKSPNPAVSSKQCVFHHERDESVAAEGIEALQSQWRVRLEDTGLNSVVVNGTPIGRGNSMTVKHGDVIHLVKPVESEKHDTEKYTMVYTFHNFSANQEEQLLKRDINAHYLLDEVIGAGSYASVKRATQKQTGKQVAVKVINLKKLEMSGASITLHKQYREVEILRKVNHPNTVRVFDIFATDDTLHLVMELAVGGDLFDFITKRGTVSPEDSKVIFKQLLGAVGYLHNMGIAHRDIKPENILLARANDVKSIKLTDFGLAKGFDGGTILKTRCGTPMYVAPEIMKRTVNLDYTAAVDVWSLGVVLWVMLTAKPPFPRMSATSSHYNYATPLNWTIRPLPRVLATHPEVRDVIESMLRVDPSERPDITKLLQHAWIVPPDTQRDCADLKPPPLPVPASRKRAMEAPTSVSTNKRARVD